MSPTVPLFLPFGWSSCTPNLDLTVCRAAKGNVCTNDRACKRTVEFGFFVTRDLPGARLEFGCAFKTDEAVAFAMHTHTITDLF
jgi:hypothetical protein